MIIYISPVNINESHTGVSKKILAQCDSMLKLGHDVKIIYPADGCVKLKDVKSGIIITIADCAKIYLFYIKVSDYLNENKEKIKGVYFRFPYPGKIMISYPLLLKRLPRHCYFSIVEIPTYPFYSESNGLKSKILNAYSIFSTYILKNKVSDVFYMGEKRKYIWGIRAERIFNAVSNSDLEICVKKNKNQHEINLIGVAQLAPWHGYDRVIRGIADYINQNNSITIMFTIVGDDLPGGYKESERLNELIKSFGLEKNVCLVGKMSGEQLDTEFKKADIAVDSLGRHRSGNNYNCSLKSKEYAYRGLPFIKSHHDDSFEGEDFVYNCPPTEDAIKISEIVDWYQNLESNSEYIHTFAKNKFSWDIQLTNRLKRLVK